MDTTSAILAVASPPGRSPRGIIRISGPPTFDLLEHALDPAGAHGESLRTRGVRPARLHLGTLDLPVLLLTFPAPHSYTGEDGAELQLPGNPLLLERVIDGLLARARARPIDARRAEAGEFTARAFLAGRLSLTEAEGIAATIAARSDAELRAAALLRRGRLAALAADWADRLATALALVEAGIDFTDQEDVRPIAPEDLRRRLESLRQTIEQQLDRAVGMEELQALPWVVLRGQPNAGKSTLFNALLGRERAVVSSRPGTTRDVLVEPLSIQTDHGPAEVMLVDLAGADDQATSASVERQMQIAADEALDRAELILHCVAPGAWQQVVREEDAAWARSGLRGEVLLVATKIDLARKTGLSPFSAGVGCAVSALTGAGLEDLRRAIAARLADRAVSLAADTLALQPRHEAALRAAAGHLREAVCLIQGETGAPLAHPELVAAAMRAALDELADLTGAIGAEDVLGRVFSTFCVGK